ncbi:monocarboxylate transporter 7-like [Gouania willdenowi]|nr:monocarboxylate transporter 7-like [Gouania willdenowi]
MRLSIPRCCLEPNVYTEVPDGGWGWAVALAFFMVEVCTYGTLKGLGVFLDDLMEEFRESNSRVSWVISICAFMFTFTAPLSTWLSNRFGYRPVVMMGGFLMSLGTIGSAFANSINEMYITVGIVTGFGYCFAFLPTLTLLTQYFSRRRALVTSVASSGESFALFAFAPALSALKQHIGWRDCLVLLGFVQASVIGCGFLLRPIIIKPECAKDDSEKDSLSVERMQAVYELENEQTKVFINSGASRGSEDSGVTSLSASNVDLKAALKLEEEMELEETLCTVPETKAGPLQPPGPKLLDVSVLREPAFVCYALFGLFATLGFFAPQLYVIKLSKSRGVETTMASSMLSVMAVTEIFGRLTVGLVLSRVSCKKTLVLLSYIVLLGLVLLAFTIVWEFWGLLLCCALYGYFMGTVGSTHIPMLAEEDVVGIHRMPSCVGVYVFIQSFGGLAGPPLSGVLVDVTENYGAAFFSCAVGVGLSAICLALVGPAKSGMCKKPSREKNEEEETISHSSEQPDSLEVDLVPENLQQPKEQD